MISDPAWSQNSKSRPRVWALISPWVVAPERCLKLCLSFHPPPLATPSVRVEAIRLAVQSCVLAPGDLPADWFMQQWTKLGAKGKITRGDAVVLQATRLIVYCGDYKRARSGVIDANSPIWRRNLPVGPAASGGRCQIALRAGEDGTHVGLNRFIWMPDAPAHPRAAA